MNTYRWTGTATALSSIAHGGETLGTVTYLRRERFLLPNGAVEEIPVISGNGLRGVLRNTGATLLWEHLERPALPLPVAHALWSGGALVKAKGEPLSGQRLQRLRQTISHVGVFGAAGGGRIIDGTLQVGKLLPICQQTAHLLPPALTATALPDMWDLLQIEYYTRLPDSDRFPSGHPPLPAAPTDQPDTAAGEEPSGLMRYGAETFIAGTRFHCWFALSHAAPAEHDFFHDVLTRFAEAAHVGGRIGRGHGQIRLDMDGPTPGAHADQPRWRDLGGADQAQALEALSWLD